MDDSYQLIIIGGGPAGLTAGMYAARSRLSTLLVERGLPGGQIVNAELVENYPGFPEGISGAELGSLMEQQARRYGLEIAMAEVEGVDVTGEQKTVRTGEGHYGATALIIAGGSEYSKLGVPGEDELRGRGVSYCATCDGAFFRDQTIAVIGGGNVALNDAIFLTRFASKVIVVHRRNELRATKILQERAFNQPKIEFLWDTVLKSIEGEGQVKLLRLQNVKTSVESSLEVSGVFIAVGLKPNTGYLGGVLALSPEGFIVVNEQMETGVPGVFAAGDIRCGSPQQISSAVGDGAVAAINAEKYISSIL
ncbi:MAG: thioredoxin-disulfide reductase [Dehalococcoidia bacterium]|nr:MAG: thioredoxin-disulfide reductase [Dehalococcoidia bacterium]